MSWVNLIGYTAAVLMFSTFYMKKMIPLRAVGASANLTFVVYASITHVYPLLILHAALFPLNILRMVQMMRLVKKVREAARGEFSIDFLVPFMSKERLNKGDTAFKEGEDADKLYYLSKGRVRLEKAGVSVGEGEVIGEIGVLSRHKKRTDTVTCETDVEFFTIPESQVLELYYQNPEFGFYLLQLIIKRLLKNTGSIS